MDNSDGSRNVATKEKLDFGCGCLVVLALAILAVSGFFVWIYLNPEIVSSFILSIVRENG